MTARIVLGALAGFAVAYLLAAFVQWQFNPGEWAKDARMACALIGFCLMCAAGALAIPTPGRRT